MAMQVVIQAISLIVAFGILAIALIPAVVQLDDAGHHIIAHGILGVTTHLARVFVHERGRSPEEVAEAAVAFVLDGIRVPVS